MTRPAPELTVVIACSRPDGAARCVRALAAQPEAARIEVFVVGDVPPAPDPPPPFPLHRVPLAEPHANARRRRGLAEGRAPRVAFLDDDAAPEPGWLAAALEVPPGALVARTGPELPLSDGATAKLVHAVSASPIGEIGSGHHHRRPRRVAWYRAPFCNFVTTRRVFEVVGEPSIDHPWDVDDFELCLRARRRVTFEADPRLVVRHDRYPDDVGRYLSELMRRRVGTGRRLVAHPDIYTRIPPVVACALAPWVLLAIAPLGPLAVGAYLAALASQAPRARRLVGAPAVPAFLGVLAASHAVTVLGVQLGVLRGLRGRQEEGSWRASS